MRTRIIDHVVGGMQNGLYTDKNGLNEYFKSSKFKGSLLLIPVAILDVGIEFYKCPFKVIEYVALAAINLLGAVFSSKYSLKDAMLSAELALINGLYTPFAFCAIPFKLFYQVFAIALNPTEVKSINYFPENTYRLM